MAVSSESAAHKRLRYEQLARVFSDDDCFSVHDIGMGLGDFYDYIQREHAGRTVAYSGSEILQEFCVDARKRFPNVNVLQRDLSDAVFADRYDYVVLSGVFHQRRSTTIPEWELYWQRLLYNAFTMCNKAVAFNFVSPFVDFYQAEVYYCNIHKLIGFVVDHLSRFFEINHAYALYEFTVFVYRPDYIKGRHGQPEFQKYFKGGD